MYLFTQTTLPSCVYRAMSAFPNATYNASLVAVGVFTASEDFSWVLWLTPNPKSCLQSSLPVSRSKQMVSRELEGFLTWVVTKTLFPRTTGELLPHPGTATDQITFRVALQATGSLRPSATPSARGPLQLGQSLRFSISCPEAEAAIMSSNEQAVIGHRLQKSSAG